MDRDQRAKLAQCPHPLVTLNEAQVAPARPVVDLAIALARCVGLRRAAVVEAPSGDRAY